MEKEKLTLSVNETAKLIGLSRISLYKSIKNEEFTSVIRIGHRILIPKSALLKLLATAGDKE